MGANLTDVCDLEHLLIVQGLLRLDETGKVDELRLVGVVSDVEDSSPRVCNVDWRLRGRGRAFGLTLELEPDIVRYLSSLHHLPQLVTILSWG